MRQAWVCEGCGLNGVVDYEPSDGVFAVVLAIRTHHETLASKYAPTCYFDIDQTRVQNPALTDKYAWNRLVGEIGQKQTKAIK
jgi:hypothetical protein